MNEKDSESESLELSNYGQSTSLFNDLEPLDTSEISSHYEKDFEEVVLINEEGEMFETEPVESSSSSENLLEMSEAESQFREDDEGWNSRFQRILEKETRSYEDYFEKCTAIGQLAREFTERARAIGKAIIAEKNTPYEKKTIKPAKNIGGVAGGEKYCCKLLAFTLIIVSSPSLNSY
eukprot:TRINITY_DN6905_c0_g1_i1.p1 TRINITY_DN6905_c0_g1~~TRINITY_DN6905_c0_g1_i1.p1  ORF type:complete len:178 (+),score=63.20 TRINITY_DN6905_c0_g1_i1:790-1323(+)